MAPLTATQVAVAGSSDLLLTAVHVSGAQPKRPPGDDPEPCTLHPPCTAAHIAGFEIRGSSGGVGALAWPSVQMYRIKDPKASLEFYSKVLGMRLLSRFDVPAGRFTLYFMGYEDAESIPTNEMERVKWMFTRRGTVELTHNWGTESDPEFKGYHTGNSDPRGWGHIGITVDDVYKACERFEALGVEFVKKPDQGQMKGIAFIKDPDGYWIEILDTKHMGELVSGEEKALS